ncbi:hypothetical protein [Flavobacterium gelatinilyticum]|uniref:hypothetical protein n=1 Tax=Flavobacterium gelatinilyticum TaxID=3003260 RepID=UPI002481764C|nr:hypothetical protein [Flavobacterium gelatinilyticum]
MNKIIKLLSLILWLSVPVSINAQTITPLAGDYKIIDIGGNGGGNYTKNLILLHQMYDETGINMNNAVGTITAFRGAAGASNRINIVEINSSSAYLTTSALIKSRDNNSSWVLKTCIYNGKKYLALDVPYSAAYHNWGFKFSGWTTSTGENMKSVAYQKDGVAINTDVLSDIQDYSPNMNETLHVNKLLIMGNNVGIGIANPTNKLDVNGIIHSKEVKVDMNGWSDFVFKKEYNLPTLEEVEKHINEKGHLKDIPSEEEVLKNGISLGEMNTKLLQKIEEMTLYMIEMKKENELLKTNQKVLEKKIQQIENK